jgi:transposase
MNILGIDVSKAKLDCVLICSSQPNKELEKRVANSEEGFSKLLEWCTQKAKCDPSQIHAIMEATGPYHESVALALFKSGCQVSVVNPAQIKHYAQSLGRKAKNDKQDASTIAQYGLKNNPRLWQPEPQEYEHLRALLYRLEAIDTDIRREKNRLEKAQAAQSPSAISQSFERSIGFLQEEKSRLEKQIKEHINNHPHMKKDRELLESIPSIGPVLSSGMSLLLRNGKRFDAASQAAAFLGLIPTEHQSGSSVLKRPHLSKAGPSIYRAKLYMPAIVAIKNNPDVRDLYQRLLAKGKTKMSALGAAMRKLVHICFGVIKNQSPYQPQLQP